MLENMDLCRSSELSTILPWEGALPTVRKSSFTQQEKQVAKAGTALDAGADDILGTSTQTWDLRKTQGACKLIQTLNSRALIRRTPATRTSNL